VNNISTCLAQQTPPPASPTSSSPSSFPNAPPPPRTALVDQARQWADKALQRASSIADQDEECNVGCAVATHNLGEFYEMEGKIQDARRKYRDAEQLAKKVGFPEGQANAKAGIARLKELEKAQK
jgi:tetratricopeptide (TPR) repeat protein